MEQKSLAFKLISSFAILFILIMFAVIYSITMNNKTQGYANEVSENWFPSLNSTGQIGIEFRRYSRRQLLILGNMAVNYTEDLNSSIKEISSYRKTLTELIEKHANKYANDPTEKKIVEDLKKSLEIYFNEAEKDLDIAKTSPKEAFAHHRNNTRPNSIVASNNIDKLTKYNYDGGVVSSSKGDSLTAITNITMSAITGVSILVAIVVFQIILKSTNSISNSVTKLKAQSVATGKIANDLKSSSLNLSDSVAEQAASIHETSAAINEITSMVNRTAENARESTNVAKGASNKAEDGQKTMLRLVAAMESIQESSSQLQNIAGIIAQINSKTAVINDIVSKTELLSLNASIESARAGEYGKGFAVVAEEVGNLAKISGKSAHEIQELITSSQEQVNNILSITKERVSEGKNVTSDAQKAFLQIADDIGSMTGVIQQISDATREQEIGVRQISTAMSQIDKATQNSQTSVNTTSESSTNLVEQSEKLDNVAKEIELLIKGKISA